MQNIKFAFVSDGEIFHIMTLPDISDLQGVIAGMKSSPIIVEIPEGMPDHLIPGLRYVNGEFTNRINNFIEDEEDYEVE